MVPIQKKPLKTVDDLLTQCIPVSELVAMVGEKMPRIKIFLLDACAVRFDPASQSLTSEEAGKLKRLSNKIAAFNASSMAQETVVIAVADGLEAAGDIYSGGAMTRAFIQTLGQALEIDEVAQNMRKYMTNPAFKCNLQMISYHDTLTWLLHWGFNHWKLTVNTLPDPAVARLDKWVKDWTNGFDNSTDQLAFQRCGLAAEHDETLRAVFKRYGKHITKLIFYDNNALGAAVGAVTAIPEVGGRLDSLKLTDCGLKAAGVAAVTQVLRALAPTLELFFFCSAVDRNRYGSDLYRMCDAKEGKRRDAELVGLIKALGQCSKLCRLDMPNNDFSDTVVRAIATEIDAGRWPDLVYFIAVSDAKPSNFFVSSRKHQVTDAGRTALRKAWDAKYESDDDRDMELSFTWKENTYY